MALPAGSPISPSVEDLIKIYQQAQARLINEILELSQKGNLSTARYKQALLSNVTRILNGLQQTTDDWIDENAEKFYLEGIEDADRAILEEFLAAGEDAPEFPPAFAVIDREAVSVVAEGVKSGFQNAIEATGQNLTGDINRIFSDKLTTGQTIKQTQAQIMQLLESKGISSVTFTRNGNPVNYQLANYASTLARSASAEITNTASIRRSQQVGGDLVKMTAHANPCPICWPLQGRVYSISGKDPDYPPLDTAYSGGYANIHPNCKHRLNPYIPALKTPQELARDKKISNRPFEIQDMNSAAQKRFERSQKIYNAGQKIKIKMNGNRKQFQRYRARLGDDAPKTFSTFMRMKNAEGDRWNDVQSDYRKKGRENKAESEGESENG